METFLIDIVMGDLWGLHSAKVMLCPSLPAQANLLERPGYRLPSCPSLLQPPK